MHNPTRLQHWQSFEEIEHGIETEVASDIAGGHETGNWNRRACVMLILKQPILSAKYSTRRTANS
jgi:hypothetical protein